MKNINANVAYYGAKHEKWLAEFCNCLNFLDSPNAVSQQLERREQQTLLYLLDRFFLELPAPTATPILPLTKTPSLTRPPAQDTATITVTHSFDYEYDEFPQEMILYFNGTFQEKLPFASVAWITPSGERIRVGDFAVDLHSRSELRYDPTLNVPKNLVGTEGSDVLNGGPGADRLSGGPGADAFVFDSPLNAATNKDTLTDFRSGVDRIQLDSEVFSTLATGALPEAAFRAGAGTTVAADADDRILYDTTTGALYYDADGSGEIAAIQVAVLGATTHPTISAADRERSATS